MRPKTSINEPQPLKNWVILLVDDTPDNLTVARTVLRFHGAEVYTATDGEQGLEMLKTLRPTVILLDIRMPKMNGWEMFRWVRGNPETRQVPIIAVTALAMENDREEMLNAGFDGYISKPFDLLNFISNIQRVIESTAAQTNV